MTLRPVAAGLATVAAVAIAAAAWAHQGGVVAKAIFQHPEPPHETFFDGGTSFTFTPSEADQSYRFDWLDGNVDPTAKFTFYYFDHQLPDAVSSVANQVQTVGAPVFDVKGRAAVDLYVSCSCDADLGVTCPDLGTGERRCEKFIDWDTSKVPDGVYWLAAVNNDPPYVLYNMSAAPVRVAHGAKRPPVVLFVKPDGLGYADQSFRLRLVVVGQPPITADLAWGHDTQQEALGPTHAIASKIPVTVGADGTWSYEWDTSKLPNHTYFVRAVVRDATGIETYTDSRSALAVYHRAAGRDDAGAPTPDAAPASDAGIIHLPSPAQPSSCAVAAHRPAATTGAWLAAALALAALALRRRPARS